MRELVARVRAAARRGVRAQATRGQPIEIAKFLSDPHVVQAYVAGEARSSRRPNSDCSTHSRSSGRVVTRDELMQRLWGRRQTRRDRTVDVFVRKLRDTVERRATHHDFSIRGTGVGYKFEPVAKERKRHIAELSQGVDLAAPTIRTAGFARRPPELTGRHAGR
jgi:DNA-binding response OmpR family regulator